MSFQDKFFGLVRIKKEDRRIPQREGHLHPPGREVEEEAVPETTAIFSIFQASRFVK